MNEILFFVVLGALFLGPLFLMPVTSRRRWLVLFAGFAAVLAVCEAASYLSTGATLSQLFWRFSESSPTGAWAIIAALAIGWALVLAHLAKRLIHPRGK
jgi:hypothetical protein